MLKQTIDQKKGIGKITLGEPFTSCRMADPVRVAIGNFKYNGIIVHVLALWILRRPTPPLFWGTGTEALLHLENTITCSKKVRLLNSILLYCGSAFAVLDLV